MKLALTEHYVISKLKTFRVFYLSNCCIRIKSTSSNKFVFIIISTNSSCSRYPFPLASAIFIISLTSFSFRFKSTSWQSFLRSSTVNPPLPWKQTLLQNDFYPSLFLFSVAAECFDLPILTNAKFVVLIII